MIFPFVAFWVILLLGWNKFELKGRLIWIALWIGSILGLCYGSTPFIFVTVQAVLDAILVLYIFGGDINIR